MNSNPSAVRLGLAMAILAVVALLVMGWWSLAPSSPAPKRASTEADVKPIAPRPQPANLRISLPPPTARQVPDLPKTPAQSEPITSEVKLNLNRAVQDVVLPAKKDCLRPFVDETGEPIEVIIDVVTYDGEVVDVGYRSFPPSPEDVVQCVADKVWEKPWETMPIKGEMRLQRTLELSPGR